MGMADQADAVRLLVQAQLGEEGGEHVLPDGIAGAGVVETQRSSRGTLLSLGAQAREEGKRLLAKGTVDLSLLDEAVEEMCTKLLYTMPDCLIKTLESLRKHKLEHWDKNRESNRAWL